MNAISAMPASSMPLSDVPDVSQFHVDAHNPKSAAQVAKSFESVFAAMVLKEMRQTLDSKTLFGGDSSDIYGGMFDQFMGQALSQSGGFGLAKSIEHQLSHLYGNKSAQGLHKS
jgi:Rod binding domain-containing protein